MRLAILALVLVSIVPATSAARGKPAVKSETVDFVLTQGGGMAPGVDRAPPQRLRVPVNYLDPLNATAKVAGAAIEAGSVEIAIPAGEAVIEGDDRSRGLNIYISVTAAGWQDRARRSSDPAVGGRPTHARAPVLPSGLHPLVSKDPTKYDNPFESFYVANDPELGFIQVKCLGIPERGARNCRITSEFSTHLTVSVRLPENELNEWRRELVAAHRYVRTILI